MSRSLQMLNVARLNVKALKSQCEAEPVPDRPGRRRSDRSRRGDATSGGHSLSSWSDGDFSSEVELLTHLRSSYDSTVSGREPGLLAAARQLLSAVKAFSAAHSDLLVSHAAPSHARPDPVQDSSSWSFF